MLGTLAAAAIAITVTYGLIMDLPVLTVAVAVCGIIILHWCIRRALDGIWVKHLPRKHVLITGCDTGFGHAAAKKCDALGCHVIAGCLTEEGCARLSSECSSRLVTVQLDVTSDDSVDRLAKKVQDVLPPEQGLWGVVNNAGALGPVGPVEWLRAEQLLALLNLNVAGVMRVTNAMLPFLKRGGGRGRVVNTASVLGYVSLPGTALYCASKHAVVGLTNSLRRELEPFGISVHMIEPGGHRTPFLAAQNITSKARDAYDRLEPDLRQQYGEKYLEQMLHLAAVLARGIASPTPDGVVCAYLCALFSRYPRLHYVVGRDAPLYMAVYWLPDNWTDWAMSLPFIQARPAIYK